jgi:hypothetical protein
MLALSSVMRAQEQWLIATEVANLMAEDVARARAANSGSQSDLQLYVRALTPSVDAERQRVLRQQVLRALNDPPEGEIVSGHALNVLLADLVRRAKEGELAGPAPEFASDIGAHLNLTKGTSGSADLLKDAGRLSWPVGLAGPAYRAERELWDSRLPEAVSQATAAGEIDARTLGELRGALEKMKKQLAADVRTQKPSLYIEGRRYLGEMADALRALSQPEAGEAFRASRDFVGRDGADLVRFMSARGLRFGPARAGDEGAYRVIHRALAGMASVAAGASAAVE